MKPFRNLKRRPLRTTLTVIGVTLAIALSFTMFSLSGGIEKSVGEIFQSSGVDIIMISEEGSLIFGIFPPIENPQETAQELMDSNNDIRGAYAILMTGGSSGPFTYASNETILKHIENNQSLPTRENPFKYLQTTGIVPEHWTRSDFSGIELLDGETFSHADDPFYQNGTYANGTDSPFFTGEILISEATAKSLHLEVGDPIYINTRSPATNDTDELMQWYDNSTVFTVNGVTKATWEGGSSLSATMHLSELQYITNRRHAANQILVDLKSGADPDKVNDWIKEQVTFIEGEVHGNLTASELFLDHRFIRDLDGDEKLTDDVEILVNGEVRQVLLVNGATGRVVFDGGIDKNDTVEASYGYKTFPVQGFTQEDFIDLIGDFLDTFKGISLIISVITAFVALLFTATVMALAVRERTVEIGVLRAMGISRMSIFRDIIFESLSISFIGFVAGSILGLGLSIALDQTMTWLAGDALPSTVSFIDISYIVILEVSALAIIIGMISGLLPASRAVRLNISEVIRSE